MKASRYLGRIRTDLSDVKGKRWSSSYLYDVMTDFLVDATSKHPQLFVEPKVIELSVGDMTDLSACCMGISRVDGVVDSTGAIIVKMNQQTYTAQHIYRRPACVPEHTVGTEARTEGAPTGYTLDAKFPTHLYVIPSVPVNKKFKVRVWCVPRPVPVTSGLDISIPSQLIPEMYRYVKAVALGTEQVSASSQSVSLRDEAAVGRSSVQKSNALASYLKAPQ